MYCRNCGKELPSGCECSARAAGPESFRNPRERRDFCSHCGQKISKGSDRLPGIAERDGEIPGAVGPTWPMQHSLTINVINTNTNTNTNGAAGFGFPSKRNGRLFFLCLFLGGLGIHVLCWKTPGQEFFYLPTAGIFGIGAVIDLIVILCGGFRDKWGTTVGLNLWQQAPIRPDGGFL